MTRHFPAVNVPVTANSAVCASHTSGGCSLAAALTFKKRVVRMALWIISQWNSFLSGVSGLQNSAAPRTNPSLSILGLSFTFVGKSETRKHNTIFIRKGEEVISTVHRGRGGATEVRVEYLLSARRWLFTRIELPNWIRWLHSFFNIFVTWPNHNAMWLVTCSDC